MSQKSSPVGNVVLDVDFSGRPLGETQVVDTYGHVFTKVGTTNASVISDTNKGNVMNFPGGSYFTTTISQDLQLSNKNFELRIVYKSNTTGENIVMATGDYYTANALVGGFMVTLNNNLGSQLFATDSVGNFTRCYFGHTNSAWEDYTFRWNATSKQMTVKNNVTAGQQVYTIPYGFGNGNLFSIGASYVRGVNVNNFIGQISRVTVTVL